MKKILILALFSILFSCERHKQEVVTPVDALAKVVDLSVIDTLITAVLQNDYHLAKQTLEKTSLELNVINEQGKLLLNEAIKLDRLLIGELLIFNGANPDLEDNLNETGRDLIQLSSHLNEWKLVLDGQSISDTYVTSESFTIVSETAVDNQLERIKLLSLYIDKGVDINHINTDNQSLLMIAASKNLIKVVDYLCSVEELDPNLSVTIIRRRREYTITAMFYAQTPQMKSALQACGVN